MVSRNGKRKKSRGGYHIPPEKELAQAIVNVLRTNPVVSSQEKMLFLVRKELRETDSRYAVTGPRLRRTAISTGKVVIETHCRETGDRRSTLSCPVCGSSTNIVKNQTLFGGEVSLAHRCGVCEYWSGLDYRMPVRYRFLLRRGA